MKRRGLTLLEVVTFVTLVTVVMTLGSIVLIRVGAIQRQTTSDIEQQQALARLAAQLREDAHAAGAAEISEEGKLRLALEPDRDAVYTVEGSTIARELREKETVTHRESYSLPASCAAVIRIEAAHGGQLVQVEVKAKLPPPSKRQVLARDALIEAAVGINAAKPAPGEGQP